MKSLVQNVRRWEFEARIFVSLSIVLFVCLLSYGFVESSSSTFSLMVRHTGMNQGLARAIGFLLAAAIMAFVSILRMWAGSVLSSQRVMAFKVQNDALLTQGPYLVVRNPIYFADLLAMIGFALCLPPTGILLPILMYVHYLQLVKYEEVSLEQKFGKEFSDYAARVPRLVPSARSLRSLFKAFESFRINHDGFRNNAIYLLFIPGFILAAFTGQFFHAAIIGLPGVFDWAEAHTKKGLPALSRKNAGSRPKKKVFADILYAQCWEDPGIDRIAFHTNADDVVFTITSGGCNALTFLLDNPRKIVALDINPYQNYLLELKMAAFRNLPYEEMLGFFGVRDSGNRLDAYRMLRCSLSGPALAYWDAQPGKISLGVIHSGRFESYIRLLRQSLRFMVGRKTIQEAFELDSPASREQYYSERWQTLRWKLFTKILLSRRLMTLLFDKAFFRFLTSSFSFGDHFAEKAKHALTGLPMKENYFLAYILLGHYYSEQHLPPYLQRAHFETIRNRLDRIEIITGSCERFFANLPEKSISKFNFTNIFEWMSSETFEALLQETVRVATENAIITYRNLLVFRERPDSLASCIRPWKELARALHATDLSFIYNNYVVEQIRKNGVLWNTALEQYATEER